MAQMIDIQRNQKLKLRTICAAAGLLFLLFDAMQVWVAPPSRADMMGAMTPTMLISPRCHAFEEVRPVQGPQPAIDPCCCQGGVACAACSGAPMGGIASLLSCDGNNAFEEKRERDARNDNKRSGCNTFISGEHWLAILTLSKAEYRNSNSEDDG